VCVCLCAIINWLSTPSHWTKCWSFCPEQLLARWGRNDNNKCHKVSFVDSIQKINIQKILFKFFRCSLASTFSLHASFFLCFCVWSRINSSSSGSKQQTKREHNNMWCQKWLNNNINNFKYEKNEKKSVEWMNGKKSVSKLSHHTFVECVWTLLVRLIKPLSLPLTLSLYRTLYNKNSHSI